MEQNWLVQVRKVHFLLRSDYEYVKQHDLQVDSCDGSFHLTDVHAYQHTEDIETGLVEYHEARWKKAVWNMPFNGMTVALHTQTDQLLKNNSTRQLIREQMLEAELRFLEADSIIR